MDKEGNIPAKVGKYTTLLEIIDDILLLVRNNNISESEDLSRYTIAVWIDHYRRMLWKKHLEELQALRKAGVDVEDLVDGEFIITRETRHKLVPVESKDAHRDTFTKVIEDTLENIYENHWSSILAVHDEAGENILYMNHVRRNYQYFRKYTFGEMTAYYISNDKKVYVQGLLDLGLLEYIYVLAIYEVPSDDAFDEPIDDPDEADVKIPTWMVPDIKKLIMSNELAFMMSKPSDDDNNSTLDGIKPNGPKEDEK